MSFRYPAGITLPISIRNVVISPPLLFSLPYSQFGLNGVTYYLHKTNQKAPECAIACGLCSKETQIDWNSGAISYNVTAESGKSGIKENIRAYDGRGPFGSTHRLGPLDVETVENALYTLWSSL